MRPRVPDLPLLAILALAAAVFVLGVQWGLPNDETWQSDSLAPYHPLVGLSQLFSFGYFNKYPLVHQWLLAILDLPVLLTAAADSVRDGVLEPHLLIANLQSPRYVTPLLMIGSLVSAAMAVGCAYLAYRIGHELAGRPAGLFAALFVALGPGLNTYAHVAKVEVPHVFWALLSTFLLARAVREQRRSDHVWSALCACLSFGSKDQAYAIFILPFIGYLALYPALLGERSRPLLARVATPNLGAFSLSFVLGTLWVENALLNHSGLIKRFRHLTGDAGFRSAAYSTDANGMLALLFDFNVTLVDNLGGPLLYVLSLGGVALIVFGRARPVHERVLQLLPLSAVASSYVFFIMIVRQSSDRFALFAGVVLAIYAGVAASRVLALRTLRTRGLGYAVLAAAVAHAAVLTARIDIDLLYDVRYDAERWLEREVPAGARIELYAARHYLPRLPQGTQAYRIKKRALAVVERKPDFIVLSSLDYQRYLGTTEQHAVGGRMTVTARRLRDRTQSEFPELYRRLLAGELGYREAKRFDRALPFPRLGSVPQTILIYKRNEGT